MSDTVLVNRIGLLLATILLAVGCNTSSTPVVARVSNVEQSPSTQEITFFVAGMNQRLKIL